MKKARRGKPFDAKLCRAIVRAFGNMGDTASLPLLHKIAEPDTRSVLTPEHEQLRQIAANYAAVLAKPEEKQRSGIGA